VADEIVNLLLASVTPQEAPGPLRANPPGKSEAGQFHVQAAQEKVSAGDHRKPPSAPAPAEERIR
jgi:hypothetical protein